MPFHQKALIDALKQKRYIDQNITFEELAKLLGNEVKAEDLKKFEEDAIIPDAHTIGHIIDWLDTSAIVFFNKPGKRQDGFKPQ